MSQSSSEKRRNNGIFLVIDDSNCACGLTDRLKAAVGLCWIARRNHIDFRMIHTGGFDIREYLEPNEVQWSAEMSDIYTLPWKRREIIYRPPFDSFPEFKKDKQYICRKYIGKNCLEMTGVPDWQREWRILFWKMFTPAGIVRDTISRSELPERYAIVNARFINSLGQTENTGYNRPLSPEMQKLLIEAVLSKISACQAESEVPVIVYSDSIRFLKIASECGFQTISPEGIGNIMDHGSSRSIQLKTFAGFFQIAQAKKVYSILNLEGFPENVLYKTQYPRYAAIIGNRPFVRI